MRRLAVSAMVRRATLGFIAVCTVLAGPLTGAILKAPAWANQAVAQPVTDKDIRWRMPVRLHFDPNAGQLIGEALSHSGESLPLLITLPSLAETADPFDGYLDQSGGLVPVSREWLPDLPGVAAGWTVTIETPPGYSAVPYPGGTVQQSASGNLTTFEAQPLIARAPLIIGKFEMAEREANGVTLRTFFTKQNARLADSYLDAAGEAIASLSDRIGPYPYEAFSVVESPLPVGIGYPGFTLVSGRILPMPFMRGRSLWHEIAHVWWGNGVFVDYERGNWAEGFAAFFADYALAESAGKGLEHRYDWLLEYDALPGSADYPLRQFVTKSHGQSQAIGYGKAAMVLVMLRQKIGLKAFDAGVQRFWRVNKFKTASWTEIEAAFQAETPMPLGPFFQRWLDEPGALAANAADTDFLTFRSLAQNERIQTLRSLSSAAAVAIEALPGAPVSTDIGKLNAPDGLPVLVGSRAALQARVAKMPPTGVAAIWATQDKQGRDVIAIHAPDARTLASLVARSRHYGRWSWLVVQESGRPQRGRWEIGE